MKDKIGVNVLKDPSNDIVGVIKMPPRSLLTPCTCVKHHFAPFPGDTWLHYFYTFIQSHFVPLVQLFPLFLLLILSLVEAWGGEARGSVPCTLSQHPDNRDTGYSNVLGVGRHVALLISFLLPWLGVGDKAFFSISIIFR